MVIKLTDVEKSNLKKRKDKYERYEKLFNDEHADVYDVEDNKKKKYISFNYLRKASKVMADGLAKNPPRYMVPEKDNQEFIEEVIFNNKLDVQLQEFVLGASYLGDCFIGVDIVNLEEFEEYGDGSRITNIKDIEYIIHFIHPKHVIIKTDEVNKRKIQAYIIQSKIEIEDKEYYKQKIITRNSVEEYYYNAELTTQDNLDEKALEKSLTKTVQHNLNAFLIQHVPNLVVPGEIYGQSDYVDGEKIQKIINELITQLIDIFKKHGNPRLVLSGSVFDSMFEDENVEEDEEGNKYVNIGEVEVVRVESDGDEQPMVEMLTWDAKTTDSLELLKFAVNQLLSLMEISPELLGSSQTGGNGPESGRALTMRIISTLNKVARLRRNFDYSLKNILYVVQLWEAKYQPNKRISSPEKVDIMWDEFYPEDKLEKSQIAREMKNIGFDLETILKEQYNYTQEQVDEILDRIANNMNNTIMKNQNKRLNFNS
ncbi:phage portal protein [Alkalibacillus sp. S2W]|uniref:phage portal protein n=1 Tax=Alkalibacillus sp. S2W TaxID=3386553 RepID=UPI00398D378B